MEMFRGKWRPSPLASSEKFLSRVPPRYWETVDTRCDLILLTLAPVAGVRRVSADRCLGVPRGWPGRFVLFGATEASFIVWPFSPLS